MRVLKSEMGVPAFILLLLAVGLDLCIAHVHGPGCSHGNHLHDHPHQHFSPAHEHHREERMKLPEELAEEEDLRLYGFGSFHEHHHHRHNEDFSELTGAGLWVRALGCSLLVSMASLICLILLPVIFTRGKPSKAVVDALALFGAGAMLGDAFLHQLPHAFGGQHSHSHNDMEHDHDHGQPHSHSLKDLSVGLSVLGGIVLFLLVEKIVRYVDDNSGGASSAAHGHHHHHHHHSKKTDALTGDSEHNDLNLHSEAVDEVNGTASNMSSEELLDDADKPERIQPHNVIRKRKASSDKGDGKLDSDETNKAKGDLDGVDEKEGKAQSPSNLVFGYLNLFSDGVHNFTDGVALGSAFLLHGSVGGWSRTLFLLAHELPQEIGDFGILVRSGFSVSKALLFNFLSALVALVGTALALLLGQDPGQSSLIEAFTAGGFIYIAVAGVLAEMNSSSGSGIKTTIVHLTFLVLGMGVALCISLVE
uniref:IAA-alanine resistance protein 1 n=1 Tax=Kalanchoe fedtschenkoi TaxID=63787 RepID=A0A7N0ULC2_KALFE